MAKRERLIRGRRLPEPVVASHPWWATTEPRRPGGDVYEEYADLLNDAYLRWSRITPGNPDPGLAKGNNPSDGGER